MQRRVAASPCARDRLVRHGGTGLSALLPSQPARLAWLALREPPPLAVAVGGHLGPLLVSSPDPNAPAVVG